MQADLHLCYLHILYTGFVMGLICFSSILQTLRSLVAMNENLKKQEQEFKAHCKEEMARLKGNIEKLKSETDSDISEDKVRITFICRHLFYRN